MDLHAWPPRAVTSRRARWALALGVLWAVWLGALTGRVRADDAGPARVELDAAAPPAAVDAGVAALVPVDAAAVPLDAAAVPLDAAAVPLDAAAVPLDAAAPVAGSPSTPTATAPPASPPPSPPTAAPPTSPGPRGDRATTVIKLVLGLAAVFVLAYLGGHRKVIALERSLGISGVIAAGFPMIALGVIARQPAVGVLTDDVLGRLQPILHFGLGWLGFIIGAQLDIRVLDRVPRGTGYLVVVEALGPFAAAAAACAALAQLLGLADWRDPSFWRDAIVLGAAAAMTAPRRFRGFASRTWREGKGVDHLLAQLDEIVGVVGLLFVAAYFRTPDAGDWQLPGTAWLFVAIGLGVVVGLLVFVMIRVPTSSGEFLAVVLGSVAFGAGLAGYLDLSPTVVCFIAGALVTNFPCEQRGEVFRILSHLERPIHLLFLVLAGASWEVTATGPWLVVPAFVVARVLGKWLAISVTTRAHVGPLPPAFLDDRALVSPLSPLAIALVLSLQGSTGGEPSAWLVTVVIGGAVLTELAVQLTAPPVARADAAPAPIDELDERSGPHGHDGDDDEAPSPGGHQPRPPTHALPPADQDDEP